jgi:hypothetical protein
MLCSVLCCSIMLCYYDSWCHVSFCHIIVILNPLYGYTVYVFPKLALNFDRPHWKYDFKLKKKNLSKTL